MILKIKFYHNIYIIMKICAILPIKHKSTRVPNKNYRDFNGNPLFTIILNTLIECNIFNKIIIDTNSDIIKKIVKQKYSNKNIILYDRPKHLWDGDIAMNVILENVINALNIDCDVFFQTHTTNPLLNKITIINSIETYFIKKNDGYDSLFSVKKLQTRLYKLENNNVEAVNHNPNELIPTQNLEPLYEENSCIYIFQKSILFKKKHRIGFKPFIFVMNDIESSDIDIETDFIIAESIHKCLVIDNKDKNKIDLLQKGKIPIYEPGLSELVVKNFKNKRLSFSTNLKKSVNESDIIFICVGTPTKKGGSSADLSQIYNVAKEISSSINKFKIIITKSTVPVTTGDEIEKIISKKNFKKKFSVVSNPEFLREGEAIRDFTFPDRIVVGSNDKKSNRAMNNLYAPLISKGAQYIHTSRRAAELIKYASNAFLATKITFINEIANLCEKTGINVEDISIGMGLDKRIGSRFLRAGPGYGGSCFPKDTKAIISTADKFKINLSVIKSVIKSNENRSNFLLNKVYKILNNKIKNKKITFLGVTFKANTDDMRDSSSLKMIPALLKKGAKVNYFDPTGLKKEFSNLKNVFYIDNIKESVQGSDLVIIHTEWNDFKSINFKNLVRGKKFIIYDMRNIYSPMKIKNQGFKYYSIGR